MYGCDVFLEALAPSFTDARGGEVLQFTAAFWHRRSHCCSYVTNCARESCCSVRAGAVLQGVVVFYI